MRAVDPRVEILHQPTGPGALERAERNEARMDAMQREAEASEDFKQATGSSLKNARRTVFHGR
jgi:hypothetical protein